VGEARYVTLMASLPYHGRLFGARQTPLSRFQLNKRLSWLTPADSDTLQSIENVLRWRRLSLQETDSAFLVRARHAVESLDSPLLAEAVRTRLEARTLVAALRMRHAGRPAPAPGERWGFGRWVDVIAQHWLEQDFGLTRQYPWVLDAASKLERGDAIGLDRLFMEYSWNELARLGAGHYFDFEAVAIYVLRWDLVDRWTHYDADEARNRIVELVDTSLGEHRDLFGVLEVAA